MYSLLFSFMSGIHDIPAKLNAMCPSYDLWNSWFGNWQKYDPASIICSGSVDLASVNVGSGELDGSEDSDAEGSPANVEIDEELPDREDAVDSLTGGADAADVVSSEVSSSVTSPSVPGTKRPAASAASNAVATLAQSRAALAKTVARPVVSSPSVQSSSSGSSKNFDVVYAKTQESKMLVLRDIESSKCQAALSQQSAEHAFQFKHAQDVESWKAQSASKLQRSEQEFQARRDALVAAGNAQERVVRQKIEFEKNVASLLVADSSGLLADAFLQKCGSRVPESDPVAAMLGQFLQSYAPSKEATD
jgi:hypothetical protein